MVAQGQLLSPAEDEFFTRIVARLIGLISPT